MTISISRRFIRLALCSLALLVGPLQSVTPIAQSATPKVAWFVRLKVDDYENEWKFGGLLLGQQSGARLGWDAQDLPAMAPFSTPYLYLTFPRPNWGAKSGDYISDFRPALKRIRSDWPFELRASKIGSTVYLRREGDAAILRRSLLVDLSSGRVYLGSDPRLSKMGIPFKMDQTSRRFIWRYLGP